MDWLLIIPFIPLFIGVGVVIYFEKYMSNARKMEEPKYSPGDFVTVRMTGEKAMVTLIWPGYGYWIRTARQPLENAIRVREFEIEARAE